MINEPLVEEGIANTTSSRNSNRGLQYMRLLVKDPAAIMGL